MKLIVGLGNPGTQYATTRHNVGFRVVDRIAASQGWNWNDKRDNAVLAQGLIDGEKIILAKPQTYMNESGRAVGPLLRFYKLPLEDLLVICDDLDLPVGRVRLREKGSAAGQHGIESIIAHLSGNNFARLKVGIGRPAYPRQDVIAYVLGIPPRDEAETLSKEEERAAEAALAWVKEGVTAAMNRYNPDPSQPKRPKPEPQTPPEKRDGAAEPAGDKVDVEAGG
jgi:aminoacyl-tRNA hydrolase